MYFYHDSRNRTYRSPFGAAPVGTTVKLRLKVRDCSPKAVYLRVWTGTEQLLPMVPAEDEYYTVSLTLPQTPGLVWYYFVIDLADKTVCYGHPSESRKGTGACMSSPESWQITVHLPVTLPEWYRSSVVYQIFPDRFARGSDFYENQQCAAHPDGWKGTSRLVMQNWEDKPFYVRDPKNRVIGWPFFGGSLEGIRKKLPYLRAMGIGVIYLNPIFLASSNHKYDTADYLQLDPGFGKEEDFKALCSEARAAGIRILLDGVFSHTGDDSIYFNRYGNFPTPGAFGDVESPYDSWYRFDASLPAGWECWWGVDSLPNVEELDPSYQEFITGENGVIQKWLELGASGWRLDVADELPDSFIRRIRSAAKSQAEDALVLGEVWEDASNKLSYNELREYLLGNELDCTMHYPFRTGALNYLLGSSSADELADELSTILEHYPAFAQQGALNLIGTHDTPRILTVLGEAPDSLSDSEKQFYTLPEARLTIAKLRLKLLQVLQFSCPGVPCIYYGDEAGMQGYADPWNRGTFPWGKEDGDLQYHVRMLSGFRKEYPVLTEGDTEYLAPSPDVFGIRRTLSGTTLLVLANRTDHAITLNMPDLSGTWLELTGGKPVTGPELTLLPYGYVMLLRDGDAFVPMESAQRPEGLGVLCPLFSLPCNDEHTLLQRPAERFLEILNKLGYRSWMLLPMNPVGNGNSPYSSRCLFAGDLRFVNQDLPYDEEGYTLWRRENSDWVEDYALYTVLRDKYKRPWQEWPKGVRDRKNLKALLLRHTAEVEALCLNQYRFSLQWASLHEKAKKLGIRLIGDLPIYAALDSADTWANRALFQLDENGYPTLRAGCPPDYFNEDGQDWGNPLYRWDDMAKDGFVWWKRRIGRALKQYDTVRLDHFRGFSEYYAIPSDVTAKNGVWLKGPGIAFFRELANTFGPLPLIAEDLGTLDSRVTGLLSQTGLPGMNVWQFSPDEMKSMTPEEASERIFFSGTHDNQTLCGYLRDTGSSLSQEVILKALAESPAAAVIFPVQDLLGLGDEARINVPGIPEGNWTWRMTEEMLTALEQLKPL